MMGAIGRMGIAGLVVGVLLAVSTSPVLAAPSSYTAPSWWAKYQALLTRTSPLASSSPLSIGPNIDASNEDGPQSET